VCATSSLKRSRSLSHLLMSSCYAVCVFVLRFLSDCVFDVCFIFYSALSVKMMMMMMMIFREGCQSAVASPLKVKSNF